MGAHVGRVIVGIAALVTSGCATRAKPKAPSGLFTDAPRYMWPVSGRVTSHFGKREHRYHYGLDIAAREGTPIRATYAGRVVRAGWQNGFGRTVILDHGSLLTLYGHCSEILVDEGEQVSQGKVIARVGRSGDASGYHLHFELRSPRWIALNPLDYLPL